MLLRLRRSVLPALPVVAVLLLSACTPAEGQPMFGGDTPAGQQANPRPSPTPLPTPAQCRDPSTGLTCDLATRVRKVNSYLAGRPGRTGVVLLDRQTGAVWGNQLADTPIWAASTIKLAMTVDLFTRERAGTVRLTAEDRRFIHQMLERSDDVAATRMWDRYGGEDYATRFPDYGLTDAQFVPGAPRRWGRMKCTPRDLNRLVVHVLTKLPANERDYIVGEMRTVAPNQQWGVWAAGSALRPGNKNGWTPALDGYWAVSSTGFLGPGGRYVLSMMNDLHGEGDFATGRTTLSHVAELLFG